MTTFLREHATPSGYEGPFDFEVSDKDAGVVYVSIRTDWAADASTVFEHVCLTVKDRGHVAKPAGFLRVHVVRGLNDLVPLPDDAGKFLGFVQTRRGERVYVFASKLPLLPIGSTSEGATSLPPVKEAAKAGPPSDGTACPCVHAGPTVHEKADVPSEPKSSEAEPDSWWQFPDAPPGSGG